MAVIKGSSAGEENGESQNSLYTTDEISCTDALQSFFRMGVVMLGRQVDGSEFSASLIYTVSSKPDPLTPP